MPSSIKSDLVGLSHKASKDLITLSIKTNINNVNYQMTYLPFNKLKLLISSKTEHILV